jgi:hypothetical protein
MAIEMAINYIQNPRKGPVRTTLSSHIFDKGSQPSIVICGSSPDLLMDYKDSRGQGVKDSSELETQILLSGGLGYMKVRAPILLF